MPSTTTEYYDDPNAPKPNSMVVVVVVAASAVVADDHGRILLQRCRDNDLWALPGGGMDLTDSLPGTAVREVEEETGLDVEITGLVGTYTDPKHIIAYTDGEVRRQFGVCFTARITGGRLEISDESTELGSCRRMRSSRYRCTTPNDSGSSTSWSSARSRTWAGSSDGSSDGDNPAQPRTPTHLTGPADRT